MSNEIQMPKEKYLNTPEIPKRENHDHFWIEDHVLYESYKTLRGLRYIKITNVAGMPDELKCNEACLKYIAKQYFTKK